MDVGNNWQPMWGLLTPHVDEASPPGSPGVLTLDEAIHVGQADAGAGARATAGNREAVMFRQGQTPGVWISWARMT